MRGVVDEADVKAGLVPIIAPDRFLEEVTKENVLAGAPMMRRAMFQFGPMLPKGPRGQVDAGLGKVTSRGTVSLIPPTQVIRQPFETHTIDGVEIVFQLTPDSEAPAEMHMFYPGLKALNLAENATHNLHNIYPIRGAQVRDANAWAKYLADALVRFAPKADVVFAQHHWPTWGNARVADFIAKQRDTYKYLHDQTLRLMNHGLKPAEIAERMTLPTSLETNFASRGYYGTLQHNAKSIYQRYIGWYDGNPANLAPLPPVPRAEKMVAYMGGAAAALAKAREDYAKGDYRWVAEVANTIVFAEPTNQEARALCADAFEQLAYQAESATWRNAYLQGAQELRQGPPKMARAPVRPDMIAAVPVSAGVRLPRHAHRPRQGRRQAHRDQLGLHRPGRAVYDDIGERRAHLRRRPPRRRCARHHHADQTGADQLDAAAGDARRLPSGRPRSAHRRCRAIAELFATLDTFPMAIAIVEPQPNM